MPARFNSTTGQHTPPLAPTDHLSHPQCVANSASSRCLIYTDLYHEPPLASSDPEQSCMICMEAFCSGSQVVRCGQCGQRCCNKCMVTWLETGSSQTCPACRNSHARTSFGTSSGAPAPVLNSPNITIAVADYDDSERFYGDVYGHEYQYGSSSDPSDDDDGDGSGFHPDPFDDTHWTSLSDELDSDYGEQD